MASPADWRSVPFQRSLASSLVRLLELGGRQADREAEKAEQPERERRASGPEFSIDEATGVEPGADGPGVEPETVTARVPSSLPWRSG